MQLLVEAGVVGGVALVVGYVILLILLALGMSLGKGTVAIMLFLTGVLAHFMFEFAGANKWYCKHGNACKV